MQQPQTRPLLGDSSAVSSTTSPTVRRTNNNNNNNNNNANNTTIHNNPVTVLTAHHQVQLHQLHQQLQQAAAVQSTNCGNQSLTFALPTPPPQPPQQNNKHEPSNTSTTPTGNHIVYLNHQNTLNTQATGMGLPPPATPTFGVGINMGLPLSLLNTSRLTSFTSNVITTSNPLLNIGLPNTAASAATAAGGGGGNIISGNNLTTTSTTDFNTLNALNSTLNTNLSTNNSISGCSSSNNSNNNINNNNNNNSGNNSTSAACVTGAVVQDINIINSGINRLNHSLNLNTSNINSSATGCLSTINSNVCNSTFTNFNSNLNQNFATINVNVASNNNGNNSCNTSDTLNHHQLTSIPSQSSLQTNQQQQQINQTLNRPTIGVLTSGFTCSTPNVSATNTATSSTSVGTSLKQLSNISYPSSLHHHHPSGDTESIITSTLTTTPNATTFSTSSDSIAPVGHATNIISNVTHTNDYTTQICNDDANCNNNSSNNSNNNNNSNNGTATAVVMSNTQTQNVCSPSTSPFSIPLKSPASNITVPPPSTPSPSPNRLLLQSPVSNSIHSNSNSNNANSQSPSQITPSPSSITATNFSMQLQQQSPIYQSSSPMNIGHIQNSSPVTSPYAPAKSPLHLNANTTTLNLNSGNNSANKQNPGAAGPGPPVAAVTAVRPGTPTIPLQQGMQVLQIIGTPQAYHQQASSQLVTTRTHHNNNHHLFGNQQIQIATAAKPPAKQPPQILPKPPANQQGVAPPQKQRVTTTITTNQVTQPQFVLATASPQQNHPTATATVIPTAQGLFLNQVLPSTGPVIVQPQPGGLQLILRAPTNAQQQTHTAQLTTQQQLIRVVTAQGMQLQGIAPTFFAVPNGGNFSSPVASPITAITRHPPTTTTTSTTTISPANSGNNNQILIQNAMMHTGPQAQLHSQVTPSTQVPSSSPSTSMPSISTSMSSLTSANIPVNHVISVPQQHQTSAVVIDQNLLPPPKKKAKKKKKIKKKDEDPPKLDLASIMKISGIGDDDDMFDADTITTDMTTDTTLTRHVHTVVEQPQQTINQQLSSHQLMMSSPQQSTCSTITTSTPLQAPSIPFSSTPSLLSSSSSSSSLPSPSLSASPMSVSSLSLPLSSTTSSTSATPTLVQNSVSMENINSQLVAQLQVPVQNTISGHLRLAVSEDGKVILHHTPEPNQPEIDQATAQALIRSLTQGIQIAVGSTSPKSAQQVTCLQNDQTGRIVAQSSNAALGQQQTTNMTMKKTTQVLLQNTLPNLNVRQNLVKSQSNVPQQQQQHRQTIVGQTVVNRPIHNIRNIVQQKNQQDHTIQQQSNDQLNQHNIQQFPTHSIQSLNIQQSPQQIDQRVLEQNYHKITVPNTVQHNTFNTIQQNLPNNNQLPSTVQILQTNDNSIHQQQAINILTSDQGVIVDTSQQRTNQDQQVQQQEYLKKEGVIQSQQQSVAINLPGQHQYYSLQKTPLGNNVSTPTSCSLAYDTQKASVVISQPGQVQQLQLQQPENIIFSNDPSCIRNITTTTTRNVEPTQPKQQDLQQTTDLLNSGVQPTACINNAPKITPEILNALSNLNPNDQLLIANANGQMQVISQQFLQQLLTGQLTNSTTRSNQPQKINTSTGMLSTGVGGSNTAQGEASQHNSQGLHGIQINAPTGQIIVNSSGGAPTIQNNIQNIVVQAAPSSQLHHSFPIHNSSFPSQFIDNLNQQQIRSLSTSNQQITNNNNNNNNNNQLQQQQQSQPQPQVVTNTKKTKVVKRTKVVTLAQQNTGYVHKSTDGNHPPLLNCKPITTTASTATASTTTLMTPIISTSLKSDSAIKLINSSPNTNNNNNNPSNSSNNVNNDLHAPDTNNKNDITHVVDNNGKIITTHSQQVVQRQRKYIQLPLEKQQMLKNIQSRIQSMLERKTLNNQNEQSVLAILCQEHNKILASGKVINAPSLDVGTTATTTSTITTVQTAGVAPVTVTSTTALMQPTTTVSAQCNAGKDAKPQIPPPQLQRINLSTNTASGTVGKCMTSANDKEIGGDTHNVTGHSSVITSNQNNPSLSYILNHNKPQKFYQVHSNNRPSALNIQNFSSTSTSSAASSSSTLVHSSINIVKQDQPQQQQINNNIVRAQQSIQCQTDELLDVKPNIELIGNVKKELLSPVQTTSPVNHQIPISPIGTESPIKLNNNNNNNSNNSTNNCKGTSGQFDNLISGNLQTTTSTLTLPSSTNLTTTTTVSATDIVTSPKQGVKRPASSPIFRQVNRIELFEKQLKIDQADAIQPDVNTPFEDKRNACSRLLKYHCFNEQVLSIKDLAKADEIFEETAKHLLGKFHSMMNKYTYLLLMESMREVRTSELMMIDRTFVAEEQSMLNRLRDQEAKANEELKKEEKPIFPKVEPESMDDMKNLPTVESVGASSLRESSSSASSMSSTSASSLLSNITVKKELEDDFSSNVTDTKLNIKPSNCISGDYDEWLEIQKELGVYPCRDSSTKCAKSFNCTPDNSDITGGGVGSASGGNGSKHNTNIGIIGTVPRTSKLQERTRVNGECRSSGANINNNNSSSSSSCSNITSGIGISNSSSTSNTNKNNNSAVSIVNSSNVSTVKNIFETDSVIKSESAIVQRNWCTGADDLERDLLEDADSLDDLTALHSAQIQQQQQHHQQLQQQQSGQSIGFCEHDDITAQVQSAIDSILNLKKRPSNPASGNSSGCSSSNSNNNSNSSNSNNGRGISSQHGGDSKDSVLDQAVRSILGS